MPEELGDLGLEIFRLMKLNNLNQKQLAERLGVKPPTLNGLIKGSRKFLLASDFATKISKALGVELSHWAPFTSDGHIAGIAPEPVSYNPAQSTRIPFLGKAAAGKPIDPETRPTEFFEMADVFTGDNLAAVEAVGDSMNDFGIQDGDMVIFRRNTDPEPNEVVLAWMPSDLGGGLTIKKFQRGYLVPESKNDAHEPIQLSKKTTIYGTYLGFVREHRPVKKQRRRK